MKTLLLSLSLLSFLSGVIMTAVAAAGRDTYVIGGEYTVHEGETIRGNLDLAFAQVTVEAGGRIEGRLRTISSAVKIYGSVGGTILSVESDIAVNESADLQGEPRELGNFPYVLLLPEMARVGPGSVR